MQEKRESDTGRNNRRQLQGLPLMRADVAGIDIGESYGSPKGRQLFTAFHKELTEKRGFATAFFSEDAKEGISAFLGKRSPKWQGK